MWGKKYRVDKFFEDIEALQKMALLIKETDDLTGQDCIRQLNKLIPEI